MPPCVVDTDVVSFYFKGAPQAQLYYHHLAGRELVISFMTVAELDHWALRSNWGTMRTARLNAFLNYFAIQPFDRSLCHVWAEVVVSEQRKGRIISAPDAWIAATAIVNNLPLISHNRKHFESVDRLVLISEG